MRTAAVLWFILVGTVGRAEAQRECRPPDTSNEAKALATLGVPLAFGPVDAPHTARPGEIRLGVEGVYIPRLDEATRTPTICRPGKGPEDTNLLFALPRPRLAVGLPGGLLLEGSWVPPVRVNDVKANLGAVALSRGFGLGRSSAVLGLRLHATFGQVNAPITCNDAALADPVSECFDGTRSDDRYNPDTYGAETSLGWSLAGGRVRPYLGGGVNLLRPRFQVHFVNRFGDLDDTRVIVNLTRGVVFGGLGWFAPSGFGVSGEIYAAPADAVTGRVAVRYALR